MTGRTKRIENRMRKGLFSVDASFAVVIILTMSLIFYMFIQSVSSSLHNLESRQKTASLIVFSNEIVRKEGAYKTNTETVSNIISPSDLDSFANKLSVSNSSGYGFKYIEWRLLNKDGVIIRNFSKTFQKTDNEDVFCINRIVLISLDQKKDEGLFRVCIK